MTDGGAATPGRWRLAAIAWLAAGAAFIAAAVRPSFGDGRPAWPHETRAGTFHCHSTYPLDQLRPALADLGALQQDVRSQLGLPQSSQPAHLFLFHNRGFYERYIERHFPGVSIRPALFIKQGHGPGMIFAYDNRDVETDLRHESTHALLHAVLPMVPLWLDEGLAEYYEMPRDRRRGGSPHLRVTRWDARLGRTPSLDRLEALERMEQMRAADYRHAWSWVHFMLHGPAPAREQLRRYLADIAAHTPPGKLSDRLRRGVPDLERAYLQHYRQWR